MKKAGVKLLLSGLSNSGKSRALSSLDPKTSLVISIDGKPFSFAVPHKNYQSFPNVEGFIYGWDDEDGTHTDGIVEVIEKFKDKFGEYPETIAIDTVSRVFQIITDNCNTLYKNFEIHSNIGKQIATFNNFLQELVMNSVNVISTTHVTFDEKLGVYVDASSGAYKKAGGAIGVHDHVSFFQVKGKKYKVYHRVPGLPCRSLLPKEKLPDEQDADDYSLAEHIKLIETTQTEVVEFAL